MAAAATAPAAPAAPAPAAPPLPATATGAVFDIDWTPAALVRSAVEDAQADAATAASWPTFDRGGLPWPTGPPVYATAPPGVRDDGAHPTRRGNSARFIAAVTCCPERSSNRTLSWTSWNAGRCSGSRVRHDDLGGHKSGTHADALLPSVPCSWWVQIWASCWCGQRATCGRCRRRWPRCRPWPGSCTANGRPPERPPQRPWTPPAISCCAWCPPRTTHARGIRRVRVRGLKKRCRGGLDAFALQRLCAMVRRNGDARVSVRQLPNMQTGCGSVLTAWVRLV